MTNATENGLAELEAFVQTPPPGTVQVHIAHEIVHRPVTKGSVAVGLAGFALDVAMGGDGDHTASAPRRFHVGWIGPTDVIDRIELDGGVKSHEVHHAVLVAVRPRGLAVRSFYREETLGRPLREINSFGLPRTLPDPGSLAADTFTLADANRLELSIGKIDRPGRLRRTMLRRDDKHVFHQILVDDETIQVNRQNQSGLKTLTIARSDYLGTHAGRAFTPDAALKVPKLRGFGTSTTQDDALDKWMWHRTMLHCGI